MALDVSVVATGRRLQVQRDQQAELQRQLQIETARREAAEAERLAAERRRQEATARELDRARFGREQIRDSIDDQRLDDRRALEVEDRRIEDRLARLDADLADARADARFLEGTRDRDLPAPLTPTAPDAATPAPDRTAQDLSTLIAERDARLAERAAEEQAFAARQAQDFERSARAVGELRENPSTAAIPPARGEVVDFLA